jgi:hypothetical protein
MSKYWCRIDSSGNVLATYNADEASSVYTATSYTFEITENEYNTNVIPQAKIDTAVADHASYEKDLNNVNVVVRQALIKILGYLRNETPGASIPSNSVFRDEILAEL